MFYLNWNRICTTLLPDACIELLYRSYYKNCFYFLSSSFWWQFLWTRDRRNRKVIREFRVYPVFLTRRKSRNTRLTSRTPNRICYRLDNRMNDKKLWRILYMWLSFYGKICSRKTCISLNRKRIHFLGAVLVFLARKTLSSIKPSPLLCPFIKIIHDILIPSSKSVEIII